MVAIVAGGGALPCQLGSAGVSSGALLVVAACVSCGRQQPDAQDFNERRDDYRVPKGLVAGSVNLGIALFTGANLLGVGRTAAAMLTGFAGYGVSLVLFVVALRNLGTARTGAYFSAAPIFGVALSLILWCRRCCSG